MRKKDLYKKIHIAKSLFRLGKSPISVMLGFGTLCIIFQVVN